MKRYASRVMFLVVGLVAGVLISRVGVNPVSASPQSQGLVEICDGLSVFLADLIAELEAVNVKLDNMDVRVKELPTKDELKVVNDRVFQLPTYEEAPSNEQVKEVSDRVFQLPTKDEVPSKEELKAVNDRVFQLPTYEEAPSNEQVKVVNDTVKETNTLIKTLPQILKNPQ